MGALEGRAEKSSLSNGLQRKKDYYLEYIRI